MSIEQHTPASDPVATGERFTDPGLPPHKHRMADTDPAAAKRAERQVVLLFTISILATIGGVVGYFAFPVGETVMSVRLSTLSLGLGLGLGMLGIGFAAVHWAKTLMSDVERTEERHVQESDPATRAEALEILRTGADESGIKRRSMLKGAVVTALAAAPLTFLVPLIGNLGGDWNVNAMRYTLWGKPIGEGSGQRQRRLARDPDGELIRAADVTVGSVFHVIPEGLEDEEHMLEEKAKAVVLLVRLDPEDLIEAEDRRGWSYDGIVAYSKICTHVGCPVALYEQQTHHLLCPCHQSTFDVADACRVVFGPAKRPLPQLPITVDDEGYLVSQSDFLEPIGASTWERERPTREEQS